MAVTLRKQDWEDPVSMERPPERFGDLRLCAECAYAEKLGRRPQAYCGRAIGLRAGQRVFAGQPACSSFKARPAA